MNYAILLLLLLAMALYVWLVSRYGAQRVHRLNRWHVAAFGAMIAVLYLGARTTDRTSC